MAVRHFVSDLHLQPGDNALTRRFLAYLEGPARTADELYLLGDVFEMWVSDDIGIADYAPVIHALHATAQAGVALYFMRGNRDFLCRSRFEQASGTHIIDEPMTIQAGEQRIALLHGDRLCTDDLAYLRYRRIVDHPLVQALYFAMPSWVRRRIAQALRERGQRSVQYKPAAIMDVNEDAVHGCFEALMVGTIIHGHTHRPDVHHYPDGRARIVLADWHPGAGEYVQLDAAGVLTRHPLTD